MPKILENIKEQIVEEARKQLFENGYSKTTIRSVATACGIGVGTMYNYFPSKDILISSFMLEDWKQCTFEMKKLDTVDSLTFLKGIHDCLKVFIDKYRFLFGDKEAASVYATVFTEKHTQLRHVLAEIVLPICMDRAYEDPGFMAGHIAESILSWTLEDVPFKKQSEVLGILLKL